MRAHATVPAPGASASAAGSALAEHMLSASESDQPGGVGRRSDLWRAALLMWQAHPWLGIGAGNFEYAVGAIVPGVRTHANNAYLQALAEGGIPLAAATAGALIVPLALFGRAARKAPLILGAFAGCTAFALHQFADDLLFFPKVGSLYWLIVGLAAGEIARLSAAEPGGEARIPRTNEVVSGQEVGTIRLAVRYLAGANALASEIWMLVNLVLVARFAPAARHLRISPPGFFRGEGTR
jgi:O-antigen ligase